MVAHENLIRDRLAEQLDVLEPGLVLVAKNFKLLNPSGSDGFIDILARDSTGMMVVIELKRTDSAAREALHEIGKYVDLLDRTKGVPARAMIVSTTWRELLVPFSYYAAVEDFSLGGFHLHLAEDGLTPLSASRIDPLPQPQERALTESQRRIEGHGVEDIDAAWSVLERELTALGIEDYVGRRLTHSGVDHKIVVAMGTVTEPASRVAMEHVLLEHEAIDVNDLHLMSNEEVVFMGLEYAGHPLNVCYPEKVGSLLHNHGWTDAGWLRSGVFKDELLYPDELLETLTEGWAGGLSTVNFDGSARIQNRMQWRRFRYSIARVTDQNPGWHNVTSAWLEELERQNLDCDISMYLYDQKDILQSLVHGTDQESIGSFVSNLVSVAKVSRADAFGLLGCLVWDGVQVNIREGLRSAYENIADWGDKRTMQMQQESDMSLLSSWHLRYAIFEKRANEEVPRLLTLEQGTLVRSDPDNNQLNSHTRPLSEFLVAHKDELQELIQTLQTHLIIDANSGVQMHFSRRDSDSEW